MRTATDYEMRGAAPTRPRAERRPVRSGMPAETCGARGPVAPGPDGRPTRIAKRRAWGAVAPTPLQRSERMGVRAADECSWWSEDDDAALTAPRGRGVTAARVALHCPVKKIMSLFLVSQAKRCC